MKIAYLLDTFPSQSETFIAREIEALRRRDFEIEVFAFNAGEGAALISQSLRAKLSPRRWEIVGRSLDLSGFAHVHAGWANHLADVARAAARENGLSWSFSAHARDLWVEGGDLKAKLASAKFASSCTLAGLEHLRGFGDNVIYAPHGLELKRYKFKRFALHKRADKPVRVVGVGRLVPKKGWDDALAALQFVDKARNIAQDGKTHARLILIGDGPGAENFYERGLRNQAKWRSSYGRLYLPLLNWRGALPHAQTVKVMRRCDCLILPSRRTKDGDRDGLANVLLEAAALGLPIVTTNAGSASDFVDETTGLLVEAGDVQALARAILRVFDEPEATLWRCENARRRVEERFDADKNIAVLAGAFGS